MGWGDELIATGQARELQERDPRRKVVVFDRLRRVRWHAMWENNPRIVAKHDRPAKAPHEVLNGPGVRPYIAAKSEVKWMWNEWHCPVGEIYFSEAERAFAAELQPPDIVIEPNNKPKASPNKEWGRERWQALVGLLRRDGFRPCQIGPAGAQLLYGVRFIETPGFRYACAVLARARGAVLPEGGLHHAAAALAVKSIVIFGGYISPRQTGYGSQVNLFTGGKACGMRIRCQHCEKAMAAITPEIVMGELRKLLSPVAA